MANQLDKDFYEDILKELGRLAGRVESLTLYEEEFRRLGKAGWAKALEDNYRKEFAGAVKRTIDKLSSVQVNEPPVEPPPPPPPTGEAKLLWEDNFDGPAGALPNSSNWNLQQGGNWDNGNNLNQYTNRPANVSLDGNGALVITARRETFTGSDGVTRNYTSARIDTNGKREFTKGYIEFRAKVPYAAGIWPALWTYDEPWPGGGEIDICECFGADQRVYPNIHMTGYNANGHPDRNQTVSNRNTTWHTYGAYFDTEEVVFYIDGKKVMTVPKRTSWPFGTSKQFIVMNIAIGSHGGDPANTAFPQTMTVDYVRVYDKVPAFTEEPPVEEPPPSPPPVEPPPTNTRVYEHDPYGKAFWLYEKRPANMEIDPISSSAVAAFQNQNRTTHIGMTDGNETPPVYLSKTTDPLYTISIRNAPSHALNGRQIRVPANTREQPNAGDSDHPLIFLDASTQTEARFWQATVSHANKRITASSGGFFNYGPEGDARPFLGNGVGCGLSYLAGMIRRVDFDRGRIDHSLRFASPNISGTFRFPATKTDQSGTRAYPMGSRFYLNITAAECDARTAPGTASAADTKFLRMICHALREYGMYASDGAGTNIFSLENNLTARWGETGLTRKNNTYSWIIRSQGILGGGSRLTDGVPWDRLIMRAE